ncbi:MAG: helix-turn-helix domain-containing protein [Acidimicrobiales bacterium]
MSERRTGSPRAESDDRPLTIAEAAEYLNVTERFMRRIVAERRVAYHKLGKFVRFRRPDLDEFVQAGRVEAPQSVLPRARRPWQSV